jgi:hypothetical protein
MIAFGTNRNMSSRSGYDAATGAPFVFAGGYNCSLFLQRNTGTAPLGMMRHRSPFVLGYGQFGYDVAKGAPFVLGTAALGTMLGTMLPREPLLFCYRQFGYDAATGAPFVLVANLGTMLPRVFWVQPLWVRCRVRCCHGSPFCFATADLGTMLPREPRLFWLPIWVRCCHGCFGYSRSGYDVPKRGTMMPLAAATIRPPTFSPTTDANVTEGNRVSSSDGIINQQKTKEKYIILRGTQEQTTLQTSLPSVSQDTASQRRRTYSCGSYHHAECTTGHAIGKGCGGILWGAFEEWFISFLGILCWLDRSHGNGEYAPGYRLTGAVCFPTGQRSGVAYEQGALRKNAGTLTVKKIQTNAAHRTRICHTVTEITKLCRMVTKIGNCQGDESHQNTVHVAMTRTHKNVTR